ncbi:hypothetical protein B9G39_09545 [Zooshikella ganghwensis]|uniref:Uncharacterized protein n=1 Tax=Zooshikella ganghwensis TaxID=202772 RepID=A0A4P9VNV4_9GAMM|nr:hypothetical protein B9G39_09545 [Zooshikella ganghwensis]
MRQTVREWINLPYFQFFILKQLDSRYYPLLAGLHFRFFHYFAYEYLGISNNKNSWGEHGLTRCLISATNQRS